MLVRADLRVRIMKKMIENNLYLSTCASPLVPTRVLVTLLLTIPRCLSSRLQWISCAQFSKLLFVNELHGFATLSIQLTQ